MKSDLYTSHRSINQNPHEAIASLSEGTTAYNGLFRFLSQASNPMSNTDLQESLSISSVNSYELKEENT